MPTSCDAQGRPPVPAGADGLIVEAHFDPDKAWSDGQQSVTPAVLAEIIATCRRLREALGAP